jgi:hypothetical protein
VILVDDKPEEAEPIIRALGLKGIPVAYFKISPEDDPPERPCPPGVRLAILDIELGLNLTGERQRVGYLLQVLRKIISSENGPYIAVLWTNYPEDKEIFDQEVFREESIPNPVVSVTLEKSKFGHDLGAIQSRLNDEIRSVSSFQVLQFWEKASYCAATQVSNLLFEIGSLKAPNLQEWLKNWNIVVSQMIRAMASEEYGKGLSDPTAALAAFYTSLNPLHGDKMESVTSSPPGDDLIRGAGEILKAGDCGDERRAKINTMLHVACERTARPWAGKIYALPKSGKWQHLPTREGLAEEFLLTSKQSEGERWQKEWDMLCNVCAPVLVEISPLCDHAQAKVRVLRLLGGLLAPTENYKSLRQPNDRRVGEFLWKLELLHLTSGVPSGDLRSLCECPADLQP